MSKRKKAIYRRLARRIVQRKAYRAESQGGLWRYRNGEMISAVTWGPLQPPPLSARELVVIGSHDTFGKLVSTPSGVEWVQTDGWGGPAI